MSTFSLVAFAIAVLLLAITPGNRVFTTISTSMGSGFKNASHIVLGMLFADVVFLLITFFSLSFVSNFLGEFLFVLKYLGAIILAIIGYQILNSKDHEKKVTPKREFSWQKNFLTGLVVTLASPRILVFYFGFISTFMNIAFLSISQMLLISVLAIVVLSSVMLFYANKTRNDEVVNTLKKVKVETVKKAKRVHEEPISGASSGTVVIRA